MALPTHAPAWLRFSDAPHLVIQGVPGKVASAKCSLTKGTALRAQALHGFANTCDLPQTTCLRNDGFPAVSHCRMESMALRV